MSPKIKHSFIAALILVGPFSTLKAQPARPPLSSTEVVALVAGGALDEDIGYEIKQRGLAFHLSDQYRTFITAAGAGVPVLVALEQAKVSDKTQSDAADASVHHLGNAGHLIGAKDFPAAEHELNAALQLGARAEAGFVMGRILVEGKFWAEASDVYIEVLRLDPNFAEAHVQLSLVFYRLGDEKMALAEAQSALAQVLENAEAHKDMGLVLESDQKFEPGEKEYREALRIKPDYAIAHENLGILYSDWGKLDQSIAEYKKAVALNPPDIANVHYNFGIAYDKKNEIDSAIREYREAKRLDPTRIDVRQNLATALSRRDSLAGIKEFNELIAIVPDFALAHSGLANAMLLRADYKGAEEECRKAIQLDPSDPNSFTIMGQALEEQGRFDDAVKAYLQAQSLDPDNAPAHRVLGRTYLEEKMYDKGIAELRMATHFDPLNSEGHDLLGKALQATGDPNGAISEYRQALQFDSKNNLIMSRSLTCLQLDFPCRTERSPAEEYGPRKPKHRDPLWLPAPEKESMANDGKKVFEGLLETYLFSATARER